MANEDRRTAGSECAWHKDLRGCGGQGSEGVRTVNTAAPNLGCAHCLTGHQVVSRWLSSLDGSPSWMAFPTSSMASPPLMLFPSQSLLPCTPHICPVQVRSFRIKGLLHPYLVVVNDGVKPVRDGDEGDPTELPARHRMHGIAWRRWHGSAMQAREWSL